MNGQITLWRVYESWAAPCPTPVYYLKQKGTDRKQILPIHCVGKRCFIILIYSYLIFNEDILYASWTMWTSSFTELSVNTLPIFLLTCRKLYFNDNNNIYNLSNSCCVPSSELSPLLSNTQQVFSPVVCILKYCPNEIIMPISWGSFWSSLF